MSLLESFACALSLSIDAFVCSVIYGNHPYDLKKKVTYALVLGAFFGFFQFLMPVIGYFAGDFVSGYLLDYDHWCAFILLALVSANMVKEAFGDEEQTEEKHLNIIILLTLSIATSIDALALGISAALLRVDIISLSLIIGIVCFVVTIVGFMVGQFLSRFKRFDRYMNLLGALVLFSIGVEVLHEHGVF